MKSGYNVLCASRGIDVSGGCINVMEEAADPELESLLFDPCCLIFYSKGLMVTMKNSSTVALLELMSLSDLNSPGSPLFTWVSRGEGGGWARKGFG